MKRKLIRVGNGWGIFLSKTILELLKVDPETDFVDFEIEKDVLTIKKHKENATEE